MKTPYFLILILPLLVGCEPLPVVEPEQQETIRPAKIFKVVENAQTVRHTFVGRVDASQTVDVSFEVSGQLLTLPVLEGQSVEANSVLATLDTTDFELSLREARVQLKLSKQDLARKQKLLKDKGISPSIVDDALAVYELRQVNYDQAREALSDSSIHAPFDGYIAKRYADNYANVRAGDKIVRINDLSELFVYASIPEKLMATVTQEHIVSFTARFAFAPGETFPLTYRENTGEADAVAQTYLVTFAMQNPEGRNILPGMTATVDVERRANTTNESAIIIPITALVTNPDNTFFVWRYDEDSHDVSKQAVLIDSPTGRGVPITDGLKGGDLIVATGANRLQRGMKVRPLGAVVTSLR
ncbi:MAG: efflux RND transporter periplasmic adaptor subunit [Pseudomonadales bacterium]|nr:efflux RND transporter periplasmic adaptor subunit [Pseudomonadales bacterium]MDG1441879.1 efflux RND transporter periplasmic adaptor subunit [Pseudomonadales bacterium]